MLPAAASDAEDSSASAGGKPKAGQSESPAATPAVADTSAEHAMKLEAAKDAASDAPQADNQGKTDIQDKNGSQNKADGQAKTDSANKADSQAKADGQGNADSQAKADTPLVASDLTVDEVKVEGNRLVPTEDITNVMKTHPGDKFNRDQVAADLKAINSLGYFDDRTLKAVPERSGSGVLLKITVTENQPVSQFSFEGNKVLSSEEVHKIFADQLEKPQNLNRLSAGIDKVEQAYHQRGYVLARVTDVKDDPDGSISLAINEGVIDDIKISGNHKTKDFIIKNAIKLKPGQVYNERQLTADLRQLYANGYFQDIRRSLAPSPNNPDKYTLKVEVDEKRTGSISLGGGLDTVAGPFGSFGVGDNNFRGRGESLSFNAQMGTGLFGSVTNTLNNAGQQFMTTARTYQISADYGKQIPGTNVNMNLSAFARDFNSTLIDYAEQRTFGTSATFSKPLGGNFRATLGLTLEDTTMLDLSGYYNNVNLIDQMATRAIQTGMTNSIPQALSIAQNARTGILQGGAYFSINPGISYDTRDSRIDPTKGNYVRASISPSLGITGATFAKTGITASHITSVTKETTLLTNIQAGTSFGSLPGFAQYRLGGFNGLPGYRMFSDLGSGTSMLMARSEIRHRLPLPKTDNKIVDALSKNVKVAMFADAGEIGGNNIYNTLLERNSMGASVGVGLRVKLPMIGMVRVDYGYPLISTLLGGRTPRVTFGFGDSF